MKIRALRTLRNDVGTIRRGQEAEVSNSDAKSLIARGLAEPVAAEKPKVRRAKAGAEAPKGD